MAARRQQSWHQRVVRRASRVDSRHLVLPQLSATGVERRKIEAAPGFRASWGPARLEDLPEYLERGYRLRRAFRTMTFPAWERAELALTWAVPMAAIAAAVLGYVQGGLAAVVAAASVIVTVVALFLAIPWVVVTGWRRAFTYAAFAVIGTGIAVGLARALGATVLGSPLLWWLLGAQVVSMAVCSMDLAGTTPIYPSTINHLGNHFVVELVEEKCTGAADCVLVCPRDVLAMDGTKRKVRIARSDDCIRCGACIVQCPSDALQFRFDDGSVADPATVRSTRLNMLGRRSVKLSSSD